MAGNYQAGHFCPVQWQPTNGVAALLDVRSHDLTISCLLHDVTGTRAAGVRARLAGPTDCQGRVQCDMDLDAPPYAVPPLIVPGVSGIAAFTLGVSAAGLKNIQVPLIVEQLHFASATDSEVKWDFDAKCNSRAGFIVYPAL